MNIKQISASEAAKNLGAKSLEDIAKKTGKHVNTLQNWHKNKPYLFKSVIVGHVELEKQNKEQ